MAELADGHEAEELQVGAGVHDGTWKETQVVISCKDHIALALEEYEAKWGESAVLRRVVLFPFAAPFHCWSQKTFLWYSRSFSKVVALKELLNQFYGKHFKHDRRLYNSVLNHFFWSEI